MGKDLKKHQKVNPCHEETWNQISTNSDVLLLTKYDKNCIKHILEQGHCVNIFYIDTG